MNAIHDIRTITALLTEAEKQATAMGERTPAAEHLVLAALSLDDPSARDFLGIDADQFRAAIGRVHAKALASVGVDPALGKLPPTAVGTGVYRSESSAQEVFQHARILAKGSHPRGITPAHIVRAAAEHDRGTVARALTELGINPASLY